MCHTEPVVVGLRERKKEATRDALVRSALLQFDERGFDHVTVDDIADACDVSPRTFFRYFGSKEDVLFSDSDVHCDRIIELLHDRNGNAPLIDALRDAVVAVADDYQDQRDLVVLRHRILEETPSLQSRVTERSHSWEGRILDEVRPKKKTDVGDELRLRITVAAATTALRVATEVWIARGGKGDLTRYITTALDQLRDGV